MNNNEPLTHETFITFCSKHYDDSHNLTDEEFYEDIMRLKYIKKLITRYIESDDLRDRLILNHLITLSNVFRPDILCKIIWLKMPEYLQYIKPFLVLMNVLPDTLYNVDNKYKIDTNEVPLDQKIVTRLRELKNE